MTIISFTSEDEVLTRSQQETFPYYVHICSKEFIVLENVFSPKYFPDVDIFAQHLPIQEGDEVLEIGSGIGFVAIDTISRGARRVVATDISPYAIKNIYENAQLHHVLDKMDIRQGSVFEPLEQGEKFDVIYWNVPFQFVETGTLLTSLQQSICDVGYQFIEEYISVGYKYLKEAGRLFFGFSSSIGKMDKLYEIIDGFSNIKLQCEIEKQVKRNNVSLSFELLEIIYFFDINQK